jgi:hypothetical protein
MDIVTMTTRGAGAGPVALTVGSAVPLALPLAFDPEDDVPVPFMLTRLARREVAPDRVPVLRIVPSGSSTDRRAADGIEEDGNAKGEEVRHDTRPAQARALRRSGMPLATIAAAIGVNADRVAQWVAEVDPVRRRSPRAGSPRVAADSLTARHRTLAAELRAAADPLQLGVVAGLAAAVTEVDGDLVSLVGDLEPVARLLDLLRAEIAIDADRLRVAIRVAPAEALDRARAEVAARLGVTTERIVAGRAQHPEQVEREIRIDVRSQAAADRIGALRLIASGELQPRLGSTG